MAKPSILVVDDEQVMWTFLEKALTRLGYTVTLSPDAEAALQAFASRRFTLVLTDLVMNYGTDHFTGPAKLLMRFNRIIDNFGPSGLLRYGLIKDKARLRGSLDRVLRWDFDRVVMMLLSLSMGGSSEMAMGVSLTMTGFVLVLLPFRIAKRIRSRAGAA